MDIKKIWKKKYATVPQRLENIKDVQGVLSVFNANIDAVVKVTPQRLQSWIQTHSISAQELLSEGTHTINSTADLMRGFLFCFTRGIAQEWLVSSEELFHWIESEIGYDTLQMGGQGGIIANVMSTCGIQNTLVHCASLPEKQAQLFVANTNLLSANEKGELKQASLITRNNDTPLIHWILEFNKGDTIEINSDTFTCPKSNRFIATWDPLNFRLHIDAAFSKAVKNSHIRMQYCLLAGYQMLTEPLADGSSAVSKIDDSIKEVNSWKRIHDKLYVHFEFASTQDAKVREELFHKMGNWADSMGVNEQELIDILEITGEDALAEECRKELSSVPLFKGLLLLMKNSALQRVQLHMFGLYITIQRDSCFISAEENVKGMMLAATIAASKAGTGSIEEEKNLLWAQGEEVGDIAIDELSKLHYYLLTEDRQNSLLYTGTAQVGEFTITAIPTIIVDKPKTLVGMGDTISSLSLVGAGLSKNS